MGQRASRVVDGPVEMAGAGGRVGHPGLGGEGAGKEAAMDSRLCWMPYRRRATISNWWALSGP